MRVGAAIVHALAGEGARVVIHCQRSVEAAHALRAAVCAAGGEAWVVTGDLTRSDACEAIFDGALAAAGRIDILVNNASVFARTPLADADAAAFEVQWRVNTLAPALLTRRLAAHVQSRISRSGAATATGPLAAVVNLLDQRLAHPASGCLPYYLSKAALAAFTQSAALELAPYITVNAVAPGPVLPPSSLGVHEPGGTLPLGRRPTPEEVARAVVWLAAAPSVTGQTIFVDGGQHLVGV